MKKKKKVRLTTEEFIERARKSHGNLYGYTLVDYKSCAEKVKIICRDHGVFEQRAEDHYRGMGCIKCAHEMNSRIQRCSLLDRNLR